MAPTTETRPFAGEQAGRLLRRLSFHINRTTKSCNADAVHDVRVAIRRFTQSIVVFERYFSGKDIRKVRRRLKKIMVAAGEVRNCDVALKFIAKSRFPDVDRLQSKLQSRRKDSSRILVNELKRWTERQMTLKCRAALGAALANNRDALDDEAIHQISRQTTSRMVKDFLEHGSEAASPKATPEDLHRFRIAAKKLRYTLELFRPLYGSTLGRAVEEIKQAQALLGDINDCVTVASIVVGYKGGNRLVGRLRKRQRRKTEEFRQRWSEEFRDGEPLRNWIDHLERPAAQSRGIKKPAASSGIASATPHPQSVAVA